MFSVVPLESATVPEPAQFPSKPANGPPAWAWLAVTDNTRAAPTPAVARARPSKLEPNNFIVSFSPQIDVLSQDTSRRIEDLVSAQLLRFKRQNAAHSNAARRNSGFLHCFCPAASSFAQADLQQSTTKIGMTKIVVKSQLVAQRSDFVANLAAFASACPVFVAALRGACHPDRSAPAMPKRKSGTGFSC
jgi:hypothetical protein